MKDPKEPTKTHTVIEAAVAMKVLTKSQKEQYQAIASGQGPQPSWYNIMPEWEKALTKQHAGKIAGGEHVIPTQLRPIAGMKNAFEKITAIADKDNKLEVLHTSKHAGTLASLTKDKASQQAITYENARQAQEWVGKDKTLHCNTFNSGPLLGAGDDPQIVRSTQQAMKNVRGKGTNTAFNAFRYFGGANDLKGAKDTLKQLASSLEGKAFDKIKARLQPKGMFGRALRRISWGRAEKDIEALRTNDHIDDKTAAILKSAVDLRRSVEKADANVRFGDSENASLATSTKLNKLTTTLAGLTSAPTGMNMQQIPKEEIL